jgi:hypothetical protein
MVTLVSAPGLLVFLVARSSFFTCAMASIKPPNKRALNRIRFISDVVPFSREYTAPAAAAEFQKFLDHRGVTINFPLGALARLGLARAFAVSGDTAKAKAAYQDFFALWKDADPDIPILKEAKAEYAKLQ